MKNPSTIRVYYYITTKYSIYIYNKTLDAIKNRIIKAFNMHYKMEKKYEQIQLAELKERAMEFDVILQTSFYKLPNGSLKDFFFVYNNLLNKSLKVDQNCGTCLKRMNKELGQFLRANPILEDDKKIISAWKDIQEYAQPKKECGC